MPGEKFKQVLPSLEIPHTQPCLAAAPDTPSVTAAPGISIPDRSYSEEFILKEHQPKSTKIEQSASESSVNDTCASDSVRRWPKFGESGNRFCELYQSHWLTSRLSSSKAEPSPKESKDSEPLKTKQLKQVVANAENLSDSIKATTGCKPTAAHCVETQASELSVPLPDTKSQLNLDGAPDSKNSIVSGFRLAASSAPCLEETHSGKAKSGKAQENSLLLSCSEANSQPLLNASSSSIAQPVSISARKVASGPVHADKQAAAAASAAAAVLDLLYELCSRLENSIGKALEAAAAASSAAASRERQWVAQEQRLAALAAALQERDAQLTASRSNLADALRQRDEAAAAATAAAAAANTAAVAAAAAESGMRAGAAASAAAAREQQDSPAGGAGSTGAGAMADSALAARAAERMRGAAAALGEDRARLRQILAAAADYDARPPPPLPPKPSLRTGLLLADAPASASSPGPAGGSSPARPLPAAEARSVAAGPLRSGGSGSGGGGTAAPRRNPLSPSGPEAAATRPVRALHRNCPSPPPAPPTPFFLTPLPPPHMTTRPLTPPHQCGRNTR